MLRIAKLTDYGIVLLTYFVRAPAMAVRTASELAGAAELPLPTVSKILKALSRGGLLVSHRGVKGGYSLAAPPEEISIGRVLEVLEGATALTVCSADTPGLCDLEPVCPVRANWRRINKVVREALDTLTLAEMAQPLGQRLQPALGLIRGERS